VEGQCCGRLAGLADRALQVIRRENCQRALLWVKAPLLVLQGDNDPRVPKEEAIQVVNLLKQDGKIVEAHYYPNEGHGFSKRENQIDSIRRTVDWFDKYLKKSH
jgi:dipeptidyl aminopeptidase/acylaminoacyl peptidase